jgi:hypothetical protein
VGNLHHAGLGGHDHGVGAVRGFVEQGVHVGVFLNAHFHTCIYIYIYTYIYIYI